MTVVDGEGWAIKSCWNLHLHYRSGMTECLSQHQRIREAMEAARGARFEHGEQGRHILRRDAGAAELGAVPRRVVVPIFAVPELAE
jgi:hypothetical protein